MAWKDKLSSLFDWITGRDQGSTTTTVPKVDDSLFKRYVDYYDTQVQTLAEDLVNGRLSVDQWLDAMETEVEHLHTTAYTLYRGGLSEMGQEDLDLIQETVDAQNVFLEKWADELRTVDVSTLSPDTLAARARSYIGAVNQTIQQATTTSLGLPRLPAYPADGNTECLSFCKCSWKIEKLPGNGNWDCTWLLGDAEHCPGCIDRAKMYSPLMIRNGQIGG